MHVKEQFVKQFGMSRGFLLGQAGQMNVARRSLGLPPKM